MAYLFVIKYIYKIDIALNITNQNKSFNICKISFNKRYLLHTYICYTPLLPFQKAELVLMLSKAWRNSQSMAVWVITVAHAEKAWVKNLNKFEAYNKNMPKKTV